MLVARTRLTPGHKPRAGFLAQATGFDLGGQRGACGEAVVVCSLQIALHVQRRVQADQVAQCERAHRGGTGRDDRDIHRRSVGTEVVRVTVGLGQRPHQDPVDQEAGTLHDPHGRLAHTGGEFRSGVDGRVRAVGAANDLDQAHDAGRVEEVQPHYPLGAAGDAGEGRDGET